MYCVPVKRILRTEWIELYYLVLTLASCNGLQIRPFLTRNYCSEIPLSLLEVYIRSCAVTGLNFVLRKERRVQAFEHRVMIATEARARTAVNCPTARTCCDGRKCEICSSSSTSEHIRQGYT